jgi:hypothetical protein
MTIAANAAQIANNAWLGSIPPRLMPARLIEVWADRHPF